MAGLNDVLLGRCDALAATTHYRKGLTLGELFIQDVAASLALPGVGFDPVRYESRKADKTENLLIDGNTYAAGSAFHGRNLTAGLRHRRYGPSTPNSLSCTGLSRKRAWPFLRPAGARGRCHPWLACRCGLTLGLVRDPCRLCALQHQTQALRHRLLLALRSPRRLLERSRDTRPGTEALLREKPRTSPPRPTTPTPCHHAGINLPEIHKQLSR